MRDGLLCVLKKEEKVVTTPAATIPRLPRRTSFPLLAQTSRLRIDHDWDGAKTWP